MALARTVVGIYSKLNAGTAAFATEEFTPPANSLLVVRVYAMRKEGSSSMGTPLISGGGLTYTHRPGATTQLAPSWSTTAAWFTTPIGGSPAKMAITVDEASNLNVYEYVVSVIAYTGYDVTTPIGGTLTSAGTNIGDGAESRELSEAPAEGDETLVCIDGDSTKAPLKPSWAAGWTLVHEKTASNESGFAIASRGASTSKTVAVTDSYAGGGSFSKAGMGAMVIRAAAGSVLTLELTDSVAISDELTKAPGKGLADALSLSDSVTKAAAHPLGDTVPISDVIAKTPGKGLADAVAIADAPTKATGKSAADSVAIADQVGKAAGKGLTDQVDITDSIAKKTSRAIADAVAIADALVRKIGKAIADLLGITDVLDTKHEAPIPLEDLPTGLLLARAADMKLQGPLDVDVDDPAATVRLQERDRGPGLRGPDGLDLAEPSASLSLQNPRQEVELDG